MRTAFTVILTRSVSFCRSPNWLWGLSEPAAIDQMIAKHASLRSEDVANAAVFMLSQPGHVTIRDLVMLPQNQDL